MNRIRLYTLIWLLIISTIDILAQWQPNLTIPGIINNPLVYGNREDFIIDEGKLLLMGNPGHSYFEINQSSLFTSLGKTSYNSWKGSIDIGMPLNEEESFYIILKFLGDVDRYIACSVNKTAVQLSEIELKKSIAGSRSYNIIHLKDYPVAPIHSFPPEKTNTIHLEIEQTENWWNCKVLDANNSTVSSKRIHLPFSENNATDNITGIICHYSKKQEGVFTVYNILFANNRVAFSKNKSKSGPKVIVNEDHEIPVLNEIMANPLKGSSEYIELHNPNNISIELANYAIVVKTSTHYGRIFELSQAGTISPGGYIVLTENAEGIAKVYPETPIDNICELEEMPKLTNKGFMIGLVRLSDNMIVDEAVYSTSLFDKGLKSKRGIALERINPEPRIEYEKNWRSASSSSKYATPGRPNSRLNKNNNTKNQAVSDYKFPKKAQSPLIIAENIVCMADTDATFKCSTHIYTLGGIAIKHLNGTETHQWCKDFHQAGGGSLAQLLGLPLGRYLVVVKLIPTGEKEFIRYFILDI